jgi:hypothetical protein
MSKIFANQEETKRQEYIPPIVMRIGDKIEDQGDMCAPGAREIGDRCFVGF